MSIERQILLDNGHSTDSRMLAHSQRVIDWQRLGLVVLGHAETMVSEIGKTTRDGTH